MSKFKNATKKITAIAASAVMVSSAAFGAGLSGYPNNFVENDKFNGYVVIGAAADGRDTTAANSIIDNLRNEFSGEQERVEITYRTAATGGGEQALIADSGSVLKLGETLDSVRTTSFDDRDLNNLLREGTLRVGNRNYDFTQEIEVMGGTFEHTFRDRLENGMSQKLFFERNIPFFEYTVDFKTDIPNADFTNPNLQGKTFTLLGNTYTISEVNNGSTPYMKLLGGSDTISIGEGEKRTVTVDGKSYEVEVQMVSASPNRVRMTINGQTITLDEYESDEIAGVNVVVTGLQASTRDSIRGFADIVIGGNEITLRHGNEVEINDERISREIRDYKVDVNFDLGGSDEIRGMTFDYRWLGSDGLIVREGEVLEDKLFNAFAVKFDGSNTVEYDETRITANRDTLQVSTTLTDGTVFNRDIAFAEELSVDPTSTNGALRLIGETRDVPMLLASIDFTAGTNEFIHIPQDPSPNSLDDEVYRVLVDGDLVFVGTARDLDNLFEHDASDSTVVEMEGATVSGFKSSYADNGLTFLAYQNWNTQFLYRITGYSRASNDIADDEYTILDQTDRGASNQRYASDAAVSSSSIHSRLTRVNEFVATRPGDDGTSTDESYITRIDFDTGATGQHGVLALENQGLLNLSSLMTYDLNTPGNSYITFRYDSGDLRLDQTGDDGTFVFNVGWHSSDDELQITLNTGGASDFVDDFGGRNYISDSDRDVRQVVDQYGTIVQWDSDRQDEVIIQKPRQQLEAKAYLVTGDVSSTTNTITVTADQVESEKQRLRDAGHTIVDTKTLSTSEVEFDVTAPRLDSEVTRTENMIVVGGPAVNTIAATLLELDFPTYGEESGVNENEAVIRYFESTNNILVYGWEARDTEAAATRLNQGGLTGSNVNVNN